MNFSLKNDYLFKEVFSKKGNEDILIDLLSAIIHEPITNLEVVKDAHLSQSNPQEKFGILDLKATINNAKIIDIEVQIANQHNITKRTIYYLSKLVSSQLIAGQDYSSLKPVIVIVILDYSYCDYPNYLTESKIVDKDNLTYELTEDIKFILLELPKIRNRTTPPKNKLEEWLIYLDNSNKEMVEMIKSNNTKLQRADEEMEYLTGEEETRRLAELREKWLKDYNSGMAYATRKGEEKGLQKGEFLGLQKGKNTILTAMLKKGLSYQDIIYYTGLNEEEIQTILRDK